MREQELLSAAETGDVQTLRFMLLQERDFNINCTDMLGRTPLQLAVNNEHQEVSVYCSVKFVLRFYHENWLKAEIKRLRHVSSSEFSAEPLIWGRGGRCHEFIQRVDLNLFKGLA